LGKQGGTGIFLGGTCLPPPGPKTPANREIPFFIRRLGTGMIDVKDKEFIENLKTQIEAQGYKQVSIDISGFLEDKARVLIHFTKDVSAPLMTRAEFEKATAEGKL
jgi:hypothetical protein